jgi:hypothetical protein
MSPAAATLSAPIIVAFGFEGRPSQLSFPNSEFTWIVPIRLYPHDSNLKSAYIVVEAFAKQTRARIGPFSAGVTASDNTCFTGVVSPVVVQVSLLEV